MEIVIDQNRMKTDKKLIAREAFPKMEEYANNPAEINILQNLAWLKLKEKIGSCKVKFVPQWYASNML